MVGIKEAVASAIQFAAGVLGPARTTDIRVEEVEIGEHKGQEVWLITLKHGAPGCCHPNSRRPHSPRIQDIHRTQSDRGGPRHENKGAGWRVTLDAFGLIEKHRADGLLIDTNLLVLFLVGKTNKSRIPAFKRTQKYTIEDFELLERLINQFRALITTPHILTEVSNLTNLYGKELMAFRILFRLLVEQMKEFCEESQFVVADASFNRLWLTDAAIASISRHSLLVLTDDLDLYMTLLHRGVDALNFNHIRGWILRN